MRKCNAKKGMEIEILNIMLMLPKTDGFERQYNRTL